MNAVDSLRRVKNYAVYDILKAPSRRLERSNRSGKVIVCNITFKSHEVIVDCRSIIDSNQAFEVDIHMDDKPLSNQGRFSGLDDY